MAPLTIPAGLCQMGFTVPIWKSYLPKEPLPLVRRERALCCPHAYPSTKIRSLLK